MAIGASMCEPQVMNGQASGKFSAAPEGDSNRSPLWESPSQHDTWHVEAHCTAALDDVTAAVEGDVDASSEDAEGGSLAEMAAAVEVILRGLGEDIEREGLKRTPLRVARALQFATKGSRQSAREIIGRALFSEEPAGGGRVSGWGGGAGGIVCVRDVDLFSCCRGCLLPFKIRCHLAYIPSGQRVVGLSKLPRIGEAYARRLQTPQRLARQLATAISEAFEPLGVAVAVEAWHLGEAEGRGARPGPGEERRGGDRGQGSGEGGEPAREGGGLREGERGWEDGAKDRARARLPTRVDWRPMGGQGATLACAAVGEFEGGRELWDEFVAMLDIDQERCQLATAEQSDDGGECATWAAECGPHREDSEWDRWSPESDPRWTCAGEMVAAARVLLREVGECPTQPEMERTAERFVRQLLAATRGSTLSLEDVLNPRSSGLNPPCLQEESSALRATDWALGSSGSHAGHLAGNGSGDPHSRQGCGHHGGLENGVRRGEEEGSGRGWDTVLDLPVASLCEHHLLPFFGEVHVGFVTQSRVQGPSALDRGTLERIVQLYGCRPQVQERLTRQVAEAVAAILARDPLVRGGGKALAHWADETLANGGGEMLFRRPREEGDALESEVDGMRDKEKGGVIVVIKASHMCMVSRGVEKAHSSTVSVATLGCFSERSSLRTAFLRTLPKGQ